MKALIIEGGGMKAAYANGVLTAFEQAGHHPWDLVVGTSAGGALAAWYSAGQAEYAEGTWKYAADPRILSYRRWLSGRGPLLDHEALLDIVYRNEHPLDVEAVRRSKWPVVVTAVDVDTGEPLHHDVRVGDTIAWLKATGRLPLLSGPPVVIDGRRLMDGGVVDPIPVEWALAQGVTDVTFVTNKPLGRKKPDPRVVVELASRRYPALRASLLAHQDLKWKAAQQVLHPPPGVVARVVAPSRPTKVSRLGRNLEAIQDAIELGHSDGYAMLASLDRNIMSSIGQ